MGEKVNAEYIIELLGDKIKKLEIELAVAEAQKITLKDQLMNAVKNSPKDTMRGEKDDGRNS